MICLLFPFLAVQKGLYRRPISHLPLAPVMARRPSSERALRRGPSYQLASAPQAAQLSFAFCSICRPLWSAARAGQLIACLSAQFAPAMACGPSGPAYLLNLPPLWRTARAGQLIIALLLHIARGPSGPAYYCLAAPHSAWPERASISSARPEWTSLSFAL